jgi:hypothetical protein
MVKYMSSHYPPHSGSFGYGSPPLPTIYVAMFLLL